MKNSAIKYLSVSSGLRSSLDFPCGSSSRPKQRKIRGLSTPSKLQEIIPEFIFVSVVILTVGCFVGA